MRSEEIRRKFLDYFASRGHEVVRSSPLVPADDPTLLFTNAGMVQFKKVFLQQEKRPYTRATSCQKCLRAGGKHNDLENVGRTARHHTFFEMLGNFSFGDYFKREAIQMAWELLTEGFKLPKERLWVSVHYKDDEARELWLQIAGLPPERIVPLGDEDNFWAMGDTGPCGPCSEIIIDQGEEVGCGKPSCGVGCDCDRYLELWNLVFMQYERTPDGEMRPLPKPCIDTGMGLERITAVLQGVRSNYDTDLFEGIIARIEGISGLRYGEDPRKDVSIRVIADHSRAIAFLIADGVLPSNEGRGYVLRRIIRRAARHGRLLGVERPFLVEVIEGVKEKMSSVYPELLEAQRMIEEVTRREEERFGETLDRGLELLAFEMERLKTEGVDTLPGEVIFKLYDTYGFPVDLTEEVAREEGFTLDMEGFQREMQEQRQRGKASWRGELSGDDRIWGELEQQGVTSTFVGYDHLEAEGTVLALLKDGQLVDEAEEGEVVDLVSDTTPFYPEAGGQVGDKGSVEAPEGLLEVETTKRPVPGVIVHHCKVVSGRVAKGERISLRVDRELRLATARNHTATHILHAVLREFLGEHVRQAGSLVEPQRLRFDFSHFSPVDDGTLRQIELEVNRRIWRDDPVLTEITPLEEALKRGATALFGEKYGEEVRVVSIADYSMELCGGTHVRRTGQIGLFRIVSEGAVAAGVRRIEALTGEGAFRHLTSMTRELERASSLLRTKPEEVAQRIERLLEEEKALRRKVEELQRKLATAASGGGPQIREINGVKVVTLLLEDADPKTLREVGDELKAKVGSGVILLGSRRDDKGTLILMVTKDLAPKYPAKTIMTEILRQLGGRGGGKETMAQGGIDPAALPRAMEALEGVLKERGK